MRDHSKSYDEASKFILSYEVIGDNLVAKLASNKKFIVPFTKENEQKLIDIMEKQAKEVKVNNVSLEDKFLEGGLALSFPFMGYQTMHKDGDILYLMVWTLITAILYVHSGHLIDTVKNNKDAERIQYFLENRDLINEGALKENLRNLGLRRKAIKHLGYQAALNEDPVTINNLDNFSINDLIKLKENIEKYMAFGLDEDKKTEDGPKLQLK